MLIFNYRFLLLIAMAKLAILEQTILLEFLYFYENDCGNVPKVCKRLQYLLLCYPKFLYKVTNFL